jgi:hypothetical protein
MPMSKETDLPELLSSMAPERLSMFEVDCTNVRRGLHRLQTPVAWLA